MTNVNMLADALSAVAALLAIAVVRGIDQRQQRFAGSSIGTRPLIGG